MKKKITILAIVFMYCFMSEVYCMDVNGVKDSILAIINANKGDFAVIFKELKGNNSILINEMEMFHTASTMKTPVMIELFKQIDEGKFSLDDSILVKNEFKSIVDSSLYSMDISRDSGESMYEFLDKKTTIEFLTNKMITESSNLATNILIDLVGAKNVNNTMHVFGAKDMQILRGVEDIKAFDLNLNNMTNAVDMALIYELLYMGKAGQLNSCKKMIEILQQQKHNDIIPNFLPKSVVVAHKTGSITKVVHDCAIVYPPNGKDYILIYLSKNVESNAISTEIGAKISKLIYDFVMQEVK